MPDHILSSSISLPLDSVSDLYSYDPDQYLRLNTSTDPYPDPDQDPIRILGFDDQKFIKIYRWKKNNLTFLIKSGSLPIPRPHKSTFKLKKKPSALKREHPVLCSFGSCTLYTGLHRTRDEQTRACSDTTDPKYSWAKDREIILPLLLFAFSLQSNPVMENKGFE